MSKTLISRDLLQHWLNENVRQAYDNGLEEGKRRAYQDGQQQGAAAILHMLLEQRLGQLDADLRDWVALLSFQQLCTLAAHLPQVNTPADLHAWLEQA